MREVAQIVEGLFSCQPSNDLRAVRLLELFAKLLEAEDSDDLDFTFTYEEVDELIRCVVEVAEEPKVSAANPLANECAVSKVVQELFRLAPAGGWDNYY